MGSGCGYLIGDRVLRLPDNSPFWQHFTRGLLLCSSPIIHERPKLVNPFFPIFEKYVEIPQFLCCKILGLWGNFGALFVKNDKSS